MTTARPATRYEVVQDARVCLRLTCLQQAVLDTLAACPSIPASRADLRAILRHPRTGGRYTTGIDHALSDLQRLGLIRRLPAGDERIAYLS